MYGKVYFNSTEELGKFLKAITGTTATFEVHSTGDDKWVLEFTGGF
jgi:hypothetical protein